MILAGEKPTYSENRSQCHFVYHKSHIDWPMIESGCEMLTTRACGTAFSVVTIHKHNLHCVCS